MDQHIVARRREAVARAVDAAGHCPAGDVDRDAIGFVSPASLRAMLEDGGEIAVVDVREEGVFGRDGHLLLAGSMPLGRLERLAPRRLPRRAARIVVCDGGDGLALRAAAVLMQSGYADVRVLEGGCPAWAAAGYRLYTGLNTAPKAFAEVIAHQRHTPDIGAEEVLAWQREGRPLRLLDCRPEHEFARMNIPGATDCPGVELVHRIGDVIPGGGEAVVVNCAGRTRSIMAVQSLIEAGAAQPVYALRGGTMGWTLAGGELETGSGRVAGPASAASRERAVAAAHGLAERVGVARLERAALARLLEAGTRTVYLFDVRTQAEFEAGHVPGAVHFPGAQLVHTLDMTAPVTNALVVLCDDDGARAAMTAYWVRQMGLHEVAILADGLAGPLETGAAPEPAPLRLAQAATPQIDADELARRLAGGRCAVVDLADSLAYRAGHVPGAWHVVRSRLAQGLPRVAGGDELVLTSGDGVEALLSGAEAARLSGLRVSALAGGNRAWAASGRALEAGDGRPTGADDDVWLRAHQSKGDVKQAMREYLQWELDLVAASASDADFRFRGCLERR